MSPVLVATDTMASHHISCVIRVTLREEERMVEVSALDHVGIAVPQLDEAVALLVEVFGAVEHRRGDSSPMAAGAPARQFGVHAHATYRVALLGLGGVHLEVFEFSAPDRVDVAPRPSDVGAAHLALRVPDVDRAVAGLAADARVSVLGDVQQLAPPHPRAGRRWVYLRTRWGLYLELVTDPD
jgi:catechol 2,3-dioxygenase-like lactoylglutathione lyase family enzyme